jgi:hypothetical protein
MCELLKNFDILLFVAQFMLIQSTQQAFMSIFIDFIYITSRHLHHMLIESTYCFFMSKISGFIDM